MPKRTRSQRKAATERVKEGKAAPPVLPPSVDPVLYATLMSAVSTQIHGLPMDSRALGRRPVLQLRGRESFQNADHHRHQMTQARVTSPRQGRQHTRDVPANT